MSTNLHPDAVDLRQELSWKVSMVPQRVMVYPCNSLFCDNLTQPRELNIISASTRKGVEYHGGDVVLSGSAPGFGDFTFDEYLDTSVLDFIALRYSVAGQR